MKITSLKRPIKHLLGQNNKIKIDTPVGETEDFNINNIVTQGGVLGGIKCSVQVDSIGKEAIKNNNNLYKYRNTVEIPPLGFVDDVLNISKCGVDSVCDTAYINSCFEMKKLKLNESKCHKLSKCPDTHVHNNLIVN